MGISVLIVDDEKVFRNYIRSMDLWKTERFILAGEAQNADDAMAFLRKTEVDVIILDVSMPGKNGVVLSGMIAGKYPRISMVAVSSFDDYDYVRQILKNGAHDYILKSRLSEESLFRTLENIEARLARVSPWELKKELRSQTADWILAEGENPFTSDNARKIAVLAQATGLENYPVQECLTVTEGICRIFEDGTEEKLDVLAIDVKNGKFLILYRFYEEISESRIWEKTRNCCMRGSDSIRRIYGVSVLTQECPLFFSDNALRSFMLHKLEEGRKGEKYTALHLTMTIGQQNRLLSAIDKKDADLAEKLVRKIYEGIEGREQAACLMVTKELMELLERISVEYEIGLDFVPKNVQLFEYSKGKSKEQLSASVSGLYRNVLREILRNGQKSYSALVNKAICYMKEHCHEPIGLSDTAMGIGANSSYLSRLFHEETGKTFTEYLNGIRVERAVGLLRENLPLKDVVSQCGFKNYGYFLKIFKAYMGKTPKEFLLSAHESAAARKLT